MLNAGEENSKHLSQLISRETFTAAPRKESVVGLTWACAPGDTSLSSLVMSRGRNPQLFILSLGASFSLHCLKRDLAATWSSEGRYAWTDLVQHGGR